MIGTGEDDEGGKLAFEERTVRVEIRASVIAPREARRAVQALVGDDRSASARLETLTLLVSEVVTNAVTHGRVAPGDEIELSAAITPKLTRVVVSDGGVGFEWPADSLPSGQVGGGYGLVLLDSQASRWGTLRAPGRFSVWFEVDHA